MSRVTRQLLALSRKSLKTPHTVTRSPLRFHQGVHSANDSIRFLCAGPSDGPHQAHGRQPAAHRHERCQRRRLQGAGCRLQVRGTGVGVGTGRIAGRRRRGQRRRAHRWSRTLGQRRRWRRKRLPIHQRCLMRLS